MACFIKKFLPMFILLFVALGCVNLSRNISEQSDPLQKKTGPNPTIEYTKPHWTDQNEVSYNLEFQVKNTSSRALEFIKITASFYDKNHNFLKGEEIYISKWQHLGPGERSPGLVMTNPNRRIKSVELEFSCKGTEPFEDVKIDATEVAKL